MSAGLVSINELPGALTPESNIAWQVDSGMYTDASRIFLDVDRTQRLMRVAGFGGLVVSNYQGEQTQIQDVAITGIGGLGSDGSISATGSASVNKVDTERTSLDRGDGWLPADYTWPTATVDINRPEVTSKISDLVQKGMSREEAWARMFDGSVRRGLLAAAKKNLIENSLIENPASSLFNFVYGMNLATGIMNVVISGTYVPIAPALYVAAVGARLAVYGRSHLSEKRWSVFPLSFQPDRLAVAAVMRATQRLVHAKA